MLDCREFQDSLNGFKLKLCFTIFLTVNSFGIMGSWRNLAKTKTRCDIWREIHSRKMKNQIRGHKNVPLTLLLLLQPFHGSTRLWILRLYPDEKVPPKKRCPRYETKLHPVVRLQFWSKELPFIAITLRSFLTRSGCNC